ncbi:FtsW/RodA/SpoVE family cell cycle protein, partial [Desulfovibrio desulfuricans]|nr:FtsW/RodA/SpoVE family cell cycle protein [Desulfovibrio desulfuricans]
MLILLLVVIGVIMVGSSSRVWAAAKFQDASYFMSRQAVFALIGVFVMYVASRISLTKLRRYGKKLFILCVIALILVLVPGLGIQRN